MIETGVIHGRFQVLHNDHLKYLMAGKAKCGHLVVGITNPDPSLTVQENTDPHRSEAFSNPLTYFERYAMIRAVLCAEGVAPDEFSVVPFPISFPDLYRYYVPLDAVFFLTVYDDWGRRKMERFRAMGLKVDILWDRPLTQKGISGKDVRLMMVQDGPWESMVPESTHRLMAKWQVPSRLKRLLEVQRQSVA
jgi:nicotinamide mononucleotide adenylyltransferase